MTSLVFCCHFAATWNMTGLCWLVQRVQYPLMEQVGVERFAAYEAAHVTRIGPVVAPVMLLEMGTALALLTWGGLAFRNSLFLLSLVFLVGIWLSTFGIQVPLHAQLAHGFDADAHARLVRSNWIRTVFWTIRGLFLIVMLHFFGVRVLG